jgi:tRNA threonylcarbamoyl adenosine modification protein YeaZ
MPSSIGFGVYQPMLGLAIHTAGPALGLALGQVTTAASPPTLGEIRHQTWPFGRDLSLHLHATLADFIQPHGWDDLAFLAVAQGPGGFTGTRIGVVTARTLAQQLTIPLFGVSTLAAIAQGTLEQPTPDQRAILANPQTIIAVDMQAQRAQRFTALYTVEDGTVAPLQAEQVLSPDAWEQVLASQSHPVLRVTAGDEVAATAPQILTLAYARWQKGERPRWAEVLPYYGQHPVDK